MGGVLRCISQVFQRVLDFSSQGIVFLWYYMYSLHFLALKVFILILYVLIAFLGLWKSWFLILYVVIAFWGFESLKFRYYMCLLLYGALKVYEIVIFASKLVKIAFTTLHLLYYMSLLVLVPFWLLFLYIAAVWPSHSILNVYIVSVLSLICGFVSKIVSLSSLPNFTPFKVGRV